MATRARMTGLMRFKKAGAIAAAVGWLFLVLVSYYVVHKPFGLANAEAILTSSADIGIAVLLYVLAAAIGHRVLKPLTFDSSLESLVMETGLGLGLVSFTTFGLGLLGMLQRWALWAILLIALALLRHELRAVWNELRGVRLTIGSRFERLLSTFLVLTLMLAGLAALAPPLAWDAQLYHLYAAKLALAQGRIGPPPDIVSFSYPGLVQMLYLAVMALKGDGGAALVHLGYAILTLGAILSFARRYLTERAGWIAGAILVAVPSYLLVSTWPYNDAGLAFYSFAALYALLNAKHDRRWLVLSGGFAGFALGMKYTAYIIPAALVLVLCFRQKRIAWHDGLWLAATCALAASPWYVRNVVFNGNPIYPFVFGGRFWDAARGSWYSSFGSGLVREPWRLLTAPWEATILGQEGTVSYEATIGPLLLALLPLYFLTQRSGQMERGQNVLRATFVFVIVLYGFWLAGAAVSGGLVQTRLLFPAMPALAVLAAVGLERLKTLDLPQFSLSGLTQGIVGVVLGLTLSAQALDWVALNPLPYLTGFETREHYLSTRLTQGYWDALQFLGPLKSPRVLFLWEPRAYYAPASAQIQTDEILDNFAHLRYLYHNADGIAQGLRAQGYTHILVARWGMLFAAREHYAGMDQAGVALLQETLARFAKPVYGEMQSAAAFQERAPVTASRADEEPYSIYELVTSP